MGHRVDDRQNILRRGLLAAGKGIDLICCIGELSENTADAAKAAGKDSATVLYFTSKDKFINQMQTIIKSGDTILVSELSLL